MCLYVWLCSEASGEDSESRGCRGRDGKGEKSELSGLLGIRLQPYLGVVPFGPCAFSTLPLIPYLQNKKSQQPWPKWLLLSSF